MLIHGWQMSSPLNAAGGEIIRTTSRDRVFHPTLGIEGPVNRETKRILNIDTSRCRVHGNILESTLGMAESTGCILNRLHAASISLISSQMITSKTTIPDSFYWPVLINNNIGSKRAYSLGRLKSALRRPRYNRLEGR
jgi:hypothetical protein